MSVRRIVWALAGCVAGCAQPAPATVAQVEVALTAADQVALQYVELPRCPAAAACSDPATVARIRAAAADAYAAVKAAEASGDAGDLRLAAGAVGALSAALPPAP